MVVPMVKEFIHIGFMVVVLVVTALAAQAMPASWGSRLTLNW